MTANHFELFGRSPMLGRGFAEADDQLRVLVELERSGERSQTVVQHVPYRLWWTAIPFTIALE